MKDGQGFVGGTKFQAIPIAIDTTTPQTVPVYTPATGKKFAVYYLIIENRGNIATSSIEFRSGSTAIGGTLPLLSKQDVTYYNHRWVMRSNGYPLFLGVAADDVFTIHKTGSGRAEGFALCDSVVA